jgi:hydrogenase/urease accessory protein HupE
MNSLRYPNPPRFAAIAVVVVLFAAGAGRAIAHPLSQGALDVTIGPEQVIIRARVTLQEVVVSDTLNIEPRSDARAGSKLAEMCARHARYLAGHIHVSADGALLSGRVVRVQPVATQPAGEAAEADAQHAVFDLAYDLKSKRPRVVRIWQDVFVAASVAGDTTWEASYVVNIGTHLGPIMEGLLLTPTEPVEYDCDWNPSSTMPSAPAAGSKSSRAAPQDRWRMFRDYLAHGVRHILHGYDHLLFIAALVLAAASLWDLVKVVSAFTLAHTITLTLAALRLVHVPGWVVEPMIAGSIVFVAAQNVFSPRQARGWSRLGVAFAFGLFHGLGFAGGLLDAMREMSGSTIVLAIAAFSLGVELGHQVIVIPLFAGLELSRRMRREPAARERVSEFARRWGSAAICVAGTYYLIAVVSSAIELALPY